MPILRLPVVIAAVVCCCAHAFAQTQPNVLLIIGDDLGPEAIGSYGHPGAPPTPNLDALAAGGMRFTRAVMNPACSPTRGALLTGRYGVHNGVPTTVGPGDLGPHTDETTLPQALYATPYMSALIGKWHLGQRWGLGTPNAYGWPHFAGIMDGGVGDYFNWIEVVNGQQSLVTTYATTHLVDEAITWIGAQTTPWMLQLALNAPHTPFQAPPSSLHTRDLAGLTPQSDPVAFAWAMVEAMDTEIGRLLASMPPAVRANTNIIFLGDNGTEPLCAQAPVSSQRVKGSLYWRGSAVPMIVQGPAVTQPGSVCDALVASVDIFPTVLQLCSAPMPSSTATLPLDGVSIVPLLQGTATSVRDHVYVDMAASLQGGGYAVRDERYELLRIQGQLPAHMEMYDIVADPMETTNLLNAPLDPTAQARFDHFMTILDGIRPDGWSEVFGSNCAGHAGVARLAAQSPPTVGASFFFRIDNMPPSCLLRIGAIGFSRTSTSGAPLPISLTQFGMTGCDLLIDVMGYPLISTEGYGLIRIPNFPVYNGTEFFMQSFLLDLGVNPSGLIASTGLRLVIGS